MQSLNTGKFYWFNAGDDTVKNKFFTGQICACAQIRRCVKNGGGCMYKDIYTPLQIQALLQPVFAAYKIKKATLFGSYAKGLAEERSDIDILVDSGLKGLAFFGLLEDVVTTLGKEVDLLDISQLTPDSQIREEIKRNGVVIYEQ